jgi:RHS repeat-associated protein
VLFVYDQNGQLLGEYDATGKAIREYVWLGDTPIAVFVPPVLQANPPVVYFIHADHLGTPQVVVDKNNAVRWQWFTEPFGVTVVNNNPGGLGAFTFPLRFPGQYADQESGLSYNYFRTYDNSTGRYTTPDPIGLAGGINPFAYVENQPTKYTDPSGLQSQSDPGEGRPSSPGPGLWSPVPEANRTIARWLDRAFKTKEKEECPPPRRECKLYDGEFHLDVGDSDIYPSEEGGKPKTVHFGGTIYCFYRCPSGDHRVRSHYAPPGMEAMFNTKQKVMNWCPQTLDD